MMDDHDGLTSSQVVGMLRGTRKGKPSRIRISRPCYDKPHRCPGWAGGGCLGAKEDRCTGDGGYVVTRARWVAVWDDPDPESEPTGSYKDEHPGSNQWRFGRCGECGLRTWPYAVRWVDWRYVLVWKLKHGVWSWLSEWRHYRIKEGSAWRIGRRDTGGWHEIVLGTHCWTNMPDYYGEDSFL